MLLLHQLPIKLFQVVWLQRLLVDFIHVEEGATEIFCENKATIVMTMDQAFHSRTKHIYIRYHYIRILVASEEVSLIYCKTKKQVADVLAKSFSHVKHHCFKLQIEAASFEAMGSIE